MNTMTVSVIIPVYQVAAYLEECVAGVFAQSYRYIQIVLVDDGSSDGSSAICDCFAAQDDRVLVIHKENGGLSDARNAGIRAATGEYVLFLDGDDFWKDPEAVEKLVSRICKTGADVLNFSYVKYFEDTKKERPYFSGVEAMPLELKDKPAQVEYLTKNGLYIASACNKLIRTSLLTEDMLFRKGVYSEDIDWCLRLLLKARSVDFLCENFYYYRQRESSITHTVDAKKCTDLCENILRSIQLCQAAEASMQPLVYPYLAYQLGTFFAVQAKTPELQTQSIDKLVPYRWLLRHHCGDRKLLMLHMLCTIAGFRRACKWVRQLYPS